MKTGWILDVYPVPGGMCVWTIDENGHASALLDRWGPTFYVDSTLEHRAAVEGVLASVQTPIDITSLEKLDFFSRQPKPVLGIHVKNPRAFTPVVDALSKIPGVQLSNADLNMGQYYFYERNLFPLAKCAWDAQADGIVRMWELLDSPWTLDYEMPPLRYAHLGVEALGGHTHAPVNVDPQHRSRSTRFGSFLLTLGQELGQGTTYVMDSGEDDLISSLNRHVSDWDPDIILTDWGDSYIFPRLQTHSERCSVPLVLSRDPLKTISNAASHSFFTYGKMVYRAGTRTLYGRLHIDTRNSFSVSHTQLDGLFEIARVAKIPIQRAARCTIGTSLSSMQYEWAIRNNCLIPMDKGQTEDFRTADAFLSSDRGGLVYEPEIGWHEDLVEFDFASMYPEIMIRHNVTPEAVNCACCPDNKVPEIFHHLCRRKGMVPAVLEPLVRKRGIYKQLIRDGHPKKQSFKARYDAFKWALVTSFGYLGFRNARFGRIEAHECVNAYSREALLTAKEIAEAEGFHFVHAIVDSLWLKKPGITDDEIERLRKKIEAATGLPLGLEGRYRWIRFCASKTNARVGVPNRYYGAFVSGETKVRGIALRRHDTPLFIKHLQEDLLKVMSQAQNLQELKDKESELDAIADAYRDRLRCGQVTPMELALTVHLTKEPSEYVHDTLSAIAAKKLEAARVPLHAGEAIQYVVSQAHDKVKDWRVTPLAFIEDGFEYDRAYYEGLLEECLLSKWA